MLQEKPAAKLEKIYLPQWLEDDKYWKKMQKGKRVTLARVLILIVA